ncbi:MAG TPA: NAD-dependent epimerase/dehydratase family protein [Stellaceae bacterium]|nr:NAD-dependent epimerase/dehydratase family protein [Stellaceae bacterium]
MARILVTGAGGFIGRALCPVLAGQGHRVIAGLRADPAPGDPLVERAEPRILGEIAPGRHWSAVLGDVDLVIHLAQWAHRRAAGPALKGEPEAAAALARGAVEAGVRRFLYMSSIKAIGEASAPGRRFSADDCPRPADAYGRVKLASERALRRVAAASGLELVIVRPPLVYGPGVGGNFARLMRLSASGLPLPFAAVANRRSLIFLDNLVDLVARAAAHPAAAGRVLLAADGADLSTPELIRALAQAQGRVARLFAVPDAVFAALRRVPGVGIAVSRLTLSLQGDDSLTRAVLGWSPPVAAEAGLVATARALAGR